MQKNNNQGYLLAETIIALTVIATVITLVYAITMNNYINQNNNLMKFNTAEGLYSAKNVKKYFYEKELEFKTQAKNDNYIDITNEDASLVNELNIKKLYFSKYVVPSEMYTLKDIPYPVRRNLKSISPSESSVNAKKCDYRYILIFKDDSYSTVGVSCVD